MRVALTSGALADFDRIAEQIEADNPERAISVVDELREAARSCPATSVTVFANVLTDVMGLSIDWRPIACSTRASSAPARVTTARVNRPELPRMDARAPAAVDLGLIRPLERLATHAPESPL
jgi:plasmid stabilization system protein ParE